MRQYATCCVSASPGEGDPGVLGSWISGFLAFLQEEEEEEEEEALGARMRWGQDQDSGRLSRSMILYDGVFPTSCYMPLLSPTQHTGVTGTEGSKSNMADSSDNGITGGLHTTLPIAMTIGAFTAIAWYNVVELNIMIWMTFRRHSGLYFYSLLASSWGIAIYALAFLMKFFQIWKNNYVSVALITIGWYAMVTGQSLVLYSRLHLVVRDGRKIRWVLYMIIVDVFLFHFPTTVMTFGANSSMASTFVNPYSIMEKIQVTAFCIQEFIISSLYLYETRRILKPSATFQKKRTRRVMMHLIYVNILIILMDITLLCTEYADLYEIQITFKGTLYSIKLRLEFAVLNSLMSLTQSQSDEHRDTHYSHSASRVAVGMETLNGKPRVEGQNADGAPASYSVFAGRSHNSPFSADIEENVVLKTTEVAIKTERVDGEGEEKNGGLENPTVHRHWPNPSPASSEMEFAGEGF